MSAAGAEQCEGRSRIVDLGRGGRSQWGHSTAFDDRGSDDWVARELLLGARDLGALARPVRYLLDHLVTCQG